MCTLVSGTSEEDMTEFFIASSHAESRGQSSFRISSCLPPRRHFVLGDRTGRTFEASLAGLRVWAMFHRTASGKRGGIPSLRPDCESSNRLMTQSPKASRRRSPLDPEIWGNSRQQQSFSSQGNGLFSRTHSNVGRWRMLSASFRQGYEIFCLISRPDLGLYRIN